MKLLLITLSLLTAAQNTSDTDQTVPALLTTGQLKKKLAQPLRFDPDTGNPHWKRVEFREVLNDIQQAFRISILLDRRIDPNRLLDAELHEEPLESELKTIAKSAATEFGVIVSTVYLGPPGSVTRMQNSVKNRRSELFTISNAKRISRRRLTELTKRSTLHWKDLERPAVLVAATAEKYKLQVKGLDRVPHDLWAGATLPGINSYEALTLILGQFDLSFRFSDDATAIEIVPLPTSPSSASTP